MKNEINVGDYVEPIVDFLKETDDISYEDLFGFVIDKTDTTITVEGIGRGMITKASINFFCKEEIPEIFNEQKIIRVKE